MNTGEARTNTFVHRVLWWLAMIGLARGVAETVNVIILFAGGRVITSAPVFSYEWLRYAGSIGGQAWGLLLVVGACGLLARKSWSWHVLTIWVFAAIPLALMGVVGDYG